MIGIDEAAGYSGKPFGSGYRTGQGFSRYLLKALSCAVALLAMASFATAQSTMSATVVGTVTDPTGAVVANATVTLSNVATGVVANSKTNSVGAYYVAYLAPGAYTLTITAPGFQKYVQTNVALSVSQIARYDVKLSLGAQSQVVTVSANATPLLQTQSVAIGGLAQAAFIQQQPMMQANP